VASYKNMKITPDIDGKSLPLAVFDCGVWVAVCPHMAVDNSR